MPPAAPIEPILLGSSSVPSSTSSTIVETSITDGRRFSELRGIRWRIDLGILPSSSSSTIDDLRRTTADSRRRYAGLRRRLLVDPHLSKDGSNSPELVIDNPLSQNPDSMWGQFFRNAELERMLDQDLSRLYPEQASYFQTAGCQSMLRRILLLWCLRHPECGYRQGMHELLAPLLYVLQADLEHLAQVRKLYEDHFVDKFDGFTFQDSDSLYNFDFKKFLESMEDESGSQKCPPKASSLDELDPKIREIVLLSDAYGAEGELGVVLSEKFLEHDAYCMFDALMNGATGAVAMVEFFLHSPIDGTPTGLPPVIEASSALYHLLSIVDSSLYSHLVELGVEPQYFALRWLRVLFGREFTLEDHLIIWDHIFACENHKLKKSVDDDVISYGILSSPRGALISSFAVSMILYLRSSLLATENPTSCLQRLLNFPQHVSLGKLMGKAKSLLVLALDANNLVPLLPSGGTFGWSRSAAVRGHSLSSDSVSPTSPLSLVPESYWEEKWRTLHKEEEEKQKSSSEKQSPNHKKGWSEKMKLSLSRTESMPSSSKVDCRKNVSKPTVRRSLLEDLSRQLGSEESLERPRCNENLCEKGPASLEDEACRDGENKDSYSKAVARCLGGTAGSEDGPSSFSDPPSPNNNENESGRSSNASDNSIDKSDGESMNVQSCKTIPEDSALAITRSPENVSSEPGLNEDSSGNPRMTKPDSQDGRSSASAEIYGFKENPASGLKERKLLSGKFPWLWKFGQNSAEGTLEKGAMESTKVSNSTHDQNSAMPSHMADVTSGSSLNSKGDVLDQNRIGTLRNLGQNMLDNIQVIESSVQQDWGQGSPSSLESFSKNILSGKGQVTVMAALKELRKISNLLSEM